QRGLLYRARASTFWTAADIRASLGGAADSFENGAKINPRGLTPSGIDASPLKARIVTTFPSPIACTGNDRAVSPRRSNPRMGSTIWNAARIAPVISVPSFQHPLEPRFPSGLNDATHRSPSSDATDSPRRA